MQYNIYYNIVHYALCIVLYIMHYILYCCIAYFILCIIYYTYYIWNLSFFNNKDHLYFKIIIEVYLSVFKIH